ncbi:MAG: endo alpha-1,4 polygalactosaminidase [Candidatus Cloacimonetes bacterium]|nr:endo alpha-1,4 polygalactosaminidase [Candidatus Cloacimonadota bacterium]
MYKKSVLIIIFGLILLFSCSFVDEDDPPYFPQMNYKQEMRSFVQKLSSYAKNIESSFIVIPQNGQELVTKNGAENGEPDMNYLNSIDGLGREDLRFGYTGDNIATPIEITNYIMTFLDICEENEVEVLVTDYCNLSADMSYCYHQNESKGYISFVASERDLNVIPFYPIIPYNNNAININSLANSKNFLYLINSDNFTSKQDFINTVSNTNYDVIIMDMFFNDEEFTSAEIGQLKQKEIGTRLVISYMSIGEAENYRYYWQTDWENDKPDWLGTENPDWEGNFKVQYWDSDWQDIIYGNDDSYLRKILDAGFDGVYLDIIDAFEYYE